MNELVTVIIPVYNVERYVERCVRSVLDQSHDALQVVLIDDGSTDGSGALCDTLAAGDARVEVVHQPNGGLSVARNTGLDRARGAWITFVDSDDYIAPLLVEELLSAATDDADIIVGHDVVSPLDSAAPAPFTRVTQTRSLTGFEASLGHFGSEVRPLNTACGKLYRAGLWETQRFPPGLINEDLFVSHALLYRARRVVVTNAVLYAYVQTVESIMRRPFSVRRLDILDAWQEAVRFFESVDEPKLTHIARRVYACRVLDALCICRRELPGEQTLHQTLKARAAQARREARPVRGYADCSAFKALAYRGKLWLGRYIPVLYSALFVRNRSYI